MTNRTKTSDERNSGFGFGTNIAQHKAGFDAGSTEKDTEASGNHQYKRSEQKDVPKGTLAERIAKAKK